MARKWWAALVLALILAAGGLFYTWHEATSRLEVELGRWSAARRAEGWRIVHAPPVRTGFPLSAALKLDGLRVEAPNGLGWQAERATLGLFPQDLRQLRLTFEGPQRLSHPRGTMTVLSQGLSLRLRLDGQGGMLEGESLRFGEELDVRRLSAQLFGAALDLRADQLVANGLPRIDTLHLTGRLTQPPAPTAAAWRAQGGALSIERAELRTGEVIALLTATLTLDAALQPEGRGNLMITGVQEAVTSLASVGLLTPNLVPTLRTVLGLAARVPPEGGPPRVEMPLELRNRRLTAARLPIGIVPAIDWR